MSKKAEGFSLRFVLINTGNISRKVLSKVLRSFDKNFERLHGEKEHLAFQFNIAGEGEGAFYAEVKEGVLYVEPYEYYDRDAIFTCSAETLFKLAGGKLDLIFAFTTGKLRVEGNLEKAMKLQSFVKKNK